MIKDSLSKGSYVGQYFEEYNNTKYTTSVATIASRQLPKGTWRISATSTAYSTSGTTMIRLGIFTSPSTSPSHSEKYSGTSTTSTTADTQFGASVERIVDADGSTTYYINANCATANVANAQQTLIYWQRIR